MTHPHTIESTVIRLVGGPSGAEGAQISDVDVYELPRLDLAQVDGIIIAGSADQQFLLTQREKLSDWVRAGGRILINGHVQCRFLEGLGTWRKLQFHNPEDLALTSLHPHPVWEGLDLKRFQFTLGFGRAPQEGLADYAQLEREGVAGFYGRGYLMPLPENATVINGLGQLQAPIDVEYELGRGRVLVHCGNDLEGFSSAERGSIALVTQLHRWLSSQEESERGEA